MKEELKKKIDDMSPEDFLSLLSFLSMGADCLEEDMTTYGEWEEENPTDVPPKDNIRHFPIPNDDELPF